MANAQTGKIVLKKSRNHSGKIFADKIHMQQCLNNFTQKCQLQTMTKMATSHWGFSQNWWPTIKNNWQGKNCTGIPYNIVKTSWLYTYWWPSWLVECYWIAIFANICTPFKVDSDMNVICLRITHTQCVRSLINTCK